MSGRDRTLRQTSAPLSAPAAEPGSALRLFFGTILGWPLKPCNVIVEGTTDVGYFELASALVLENTGRRLLDDDFAVIAVGERDKGGTDGMVKRFQVIRQMLIENPPDPKDPLAFIALLDDDMPGRRAWSILKSAVGLTECRDMFKVCRVLPRTPGNSHQIQERVKAANADWAGMDCEIEDLVSADLLSSYAEEKPATLLRTPAMRASGHHFDWRGDAKPDLLRYVRDNALQADIIRLIEFVKSLRALFGLDPDGSLAVIPDVVSSTTD